MGVTARCDYHLAPMRPLSRVSVAALSCALAACGGSVRPSESTDGSVSSDGARDGAIDSGPARDANAVDSQPIGPDGSGPLCPPGVPELGVCQGNAVIRCLNGAVDFRPCAATEQCQSSVAGAPAQCVARQPETFNASVSGRVTYSRRPISTMGLGAVEQFGLEGVTVTVINSSSGATVGTAVTDGMGHYSIAAMVTSGAMLAARVTASRNDSTYRFSVENFSGAAYAVTTMPFAAMTSVSRDVDITEGNNGGAFAIFDTIRTGLDFVRRSLPSAAPQLRVRWERGRTTPGGTSYFQPGRNQIYLLGGPRDIDEYDKPVVLHEFGHFVEANFSRTNSPGGSHDGSPTDPRLAWGEGFGTWFGCAANGSDPHYVDTLIDGSVRNQTDLANVSLERNNMGDPMQPLSQNVGEYLVGGSLWALLSAGMGPSVQLTKMLNVSTQHFTRSPLPNRGVTGIDFVDFLDGYLCLNAGADRDVIQRYVVTERGFPYDFNYMGVCR